MKQRKILDQTEYKPITRLSEKPVATFSLSDCYVTAQVSTLHSVGTVPYSSLTAFVAR